MDSEEQVMRLSEFIEEKCMSKLLETTGKGHKSLVIDFAALASFDPTTAEELLENPEEIVKAAELAAQEFDLPESVPKLRVRFKNLPETQKVAIRDIRSDDIGRFILVEGLVRQKSDVRPQVVSSRFECPSCGNIISILQLESSFKEPSRCGCGRKGKFRLISKELVDAQGIVLEETPESLEGGEQPKRINVFLKEDLVSPISEKRTNPGSKIRVVGFVKEIPIIHKGSKSTRFDLLLEANHVESVEEDFYEIEISREEEAQILELSRDPKVYDRMIASIAPSIYGYKRVKESLLLQLMGGTQKKRSDGIVSRGDIHVLLVGDPGAGKSQLLKRISLIAPKGRYVSGKGVSGAGITASVVKDEFLGGWSLEAGALVLANNGLVSIDEMDKMSHEDRGAMHEAMEQQTVSISKANIQATLLAKTTVLAAANPKFGRFDPYGIIAEQIDLPPTLINRFDLIFPIKDLPSQERDEKLARHILNLHQDPSIELQELPTSFLKKYIAYARQKVRPKLTDSALNEIKDFYVSMRNKGGADERTERAIPISARQLEALVRLAEASARVRLSDRVTKRDARRAIDLISYCLLQVGLDRETGRIDIDRIATGIAASQRDKIFQMKEILAALEGKIGKTIPIDDVLKAAIERGIAESEAEEIIERLKRSGDVYEPRFGFVSRI
ncbi:minichromosome maintenance protein MCM [Candidatus Woesearchaeota archaeon]|nr:minichromosome maintenance protein MCM [Candidatus Woesearchaeota archaeon]